MFLNTILGSGKGLTTQLGHQLWWSWKGKNCKSF